ncbi:FAD-binding oxidoreductase [Hoeflea prorocentri]|uniref:D-lactate dehydrogenase (cytochrome) n=1 Tax=Hoeflea prorocentri TaxID=1922333 RepID=A0A9X3ZGJ3_9HYPH|nr:FAD-linked oxidase C-terminal domain-containing protein [Hoeflea prorocentri]MCY6379963.1 FAD-binding protein [Hoeflea prorocentri]MDA5397763.1 FAD-binding protein [Hoeflea prorocentri]
MVLKDATAGPRNEKGIAAVIGVLKQRFGERLNTGHSTREQHSHTTTYIPEQLPDAVVFAENGAEVQEIVRLCADHEVPIIPFGTGSSLEGQVNAPLGGISIDTASMNRILEVNAEDLDCVVEPGVTREDLNVHLRDTGLFFPIDPGANASIGGMAATRASGTNAVRYGTMKDNVLSLTAVTADGRHITTGSRARKSSAGYDLTRLFVGSEGTLGVITSVTLRLFGIPQSIISGVCPFPTVSDAVNAVIMTIQMGIPVARIELLDALSIKATNAYSGLSNPEMPALFLEFHGTEQSAKEQAKMFGEIAAEFGSGEFIWAGEQEERSKLWKARHNLYFATLQLRPGAKAIATDVCVPISRLSDCIGAAQEDAAECGFAAPIVGHVGDGNFHVTLLVDEDSSAEIGAAEAFVSRLNERAVVMGGTCSGEHGIGQGKKSALVDEMGDALVTMRQIKAGLDPANIMNPGKIF